MTGNLLVVLAAVLLLAGCPQIDSRDPQERLRAVARLKDQQALATVAAGDPSPEVRQAALARIVDEAALAVVAQQDSDPALAARALDRITAEAPLLQVARTARDWNLRQAAVERLPLSACLPLALDPANESLASAAVGRMTDQDELAEVALRSPHRSVRALAVGRLADQSRLARVVRETEDEEHRRQFAEKLNGLAELRELARTALDPVVRVICRMNLVRAGAAESLSPDESAEAEFAVRALGDRFGAAEAAAKLRDPHALAYLAGRANGLARAIARLSLALRNETIVARCGPSEIGVDHERKQAVYVEEGSNRKFEVGGERVVIWIEQGGKRAAAGNWETTFPLMNPREGFLDAPVELAILLEDVLRNSVFRAEDLRAIYERATDPALRVAAIRGMRDDGLLESIARHGRWIDIVQAAVETISSPEVLSALASDPAVDSTARTAAVRRIDEPSVLERIARGTDDYYLRAAIFEKAPDLKEKLKAPPPAAR